MSDVSPFIILSLPRSRTFWLSKFLTYGGWHCGHDELRHVRTLADVNSWLSQPFTGTVETAAAPFWRLIPSNVRIVIVRRPVEQVVDSMMASMSAGTFDCGSMTRLMRRQNAKLTQVAERTKCVQIGFEQLSNETACRELFEYCLPYDFDREWWRNISSINLQISMPEFMRYIISHKPQIDGAAYQAKVATITALKERHKWRLL